MDIQKLPQFPSVAANAVSTLDLSLLRGKSVHALIFEMGGTFTKEQITDIKLSVGSKAIVSGISGDKLQKLNSYEGLADTTNYLVLYFGDPTARTITGQHMTDLDLSFYGDLSATLEVTIGAATSPRLQVYALTAPPKQAMGIGFGQADAASLRALVRTVITPSAAVNKQNYTIGVGSSAGAMIRRIAFYHSNLTSVEFKKNGFTRHDDVSIPLNEAIQVDFARSPQSGLYVLDRIVDQNQGEAESTVDANGRPWPFEVNLTTSAADTIYAFADIRAALPLL